MIKTLTTTSDYFRFVCESFIRDGWDSLDDYDKELLKASDRGRLRIIESKPKDEEKKIK